MGKSRTIANPSPGTCRADALRKLDTLITRRTKLNRTTLIVSLKIGSLVSFIILLYAQDLIAAFREALSDEASSYLLAIPILLAFIVSCKSACTMIPSQPERQLDTQRARASYVALDNCVVYPYQL